MRRFRLPAGLVLVMSAVLLARLGMTGHMAAHMIAVAVAAPLIALGVRGSRADPAGRSPFLADPLAMSVVELGVVWLWHLPAARRAVSHGSPLFVAEIACFLLAGILLWSAVFAARDAARAAGVGALLLTSMHMTLLGALIGLAPRPLYPAMAQTAPLGLTPLADQQLAGVVMLVIGGISYLIGGLAVLGGLLREEARPT